MLGGSWGILGLNTHLSLRDVLLYAETIFFYFSFISLFLPLFRIVLLVHSLTYSRRVQQNHVKGKMYIQSYNASHICVPNSLFIYLRYLSCERAHCFHLFGTQI